MKILLPKKISWLFLTFFFTFDAVVSYIAVTRMGGHEANLSIAFAVEKYPLLYFVTIPGLVIIMNFIILGLTKLVMRFINKNNLKKETIKQIILTAVVIHWAIANSFMNLMFMIGHRLTIPDWYKLTALGFIAGTIYSLYMLKTLLEFPNHMTEEDG